MTARATTSGLHPAHGKVSRSHPPVHRKHNKFFQEGRGFPGHSVAIPSFVHGIQTSKFLSSPRRSNDRKEYYFAGNDSLDWDAYRTWRGHRHVDFKAT